MFRKIIFCVLTLCFTACSVSLGPQPLSQLESIPLELTTHLGDQQIYFEGDEIQFLLSLGSEAYIYMYYINANGNILQLLPDNEQISNHYLPGYFLTIPEYDNHYRFTVSQPFGEQSIWVFASDRSIAMDIKNVSITAIKQKIKQASKKAYGEYELKIATREK